MTLEIFTIGLLAVSLLTGFTTEGLKRIAQDFKVKYSANVMAVGSAVSLAVTVGICYMIVTETPFDAKMGVYIFALAFLSALIAMNGYDKVMQALEQIRKLKSLKGV